MKNKSLLVLLAALCLSLCLGLRVAAQGSGITYQGHLTFDGTAVIGIYDLRFAIYDDASGNGIVAGPLTNNAVAISNGLFAVTVDFGAAVFDGRPRWLEIGVRGATSGLPFSALSPRQAFTSTPYAVLARQAATVTNGAITAVQLAESAVTGGKIAGNAVVRSLNALQDNVVLEAGAGLTLLTNGNALRLAASGMTSGGVPNGLMEFTTPGTNSFVIPEGVTRLMIEVWGGGGGGGGGQGNVGLQGGGGGGGGGSGGYARRLLSVSFGQTYHVVLGAGGAAGAVGAAGGAGAHCNFQTTAGDILCWASGGDGGQTGSTTSRAGGPGGAGGTGDPAALLKRTGASGAPGTAAGSGTFSSTVGIGGMGGAAISGTVAPAGSAGGRGGDGLSNAGVTAGGNAYALLYW